MKEQKNVWRFEGEVLDLEWVMDKLTHLGIMLKDDEDESIRIEMIKEFIGTQEEEKQKLLNCGNCNNSLMRNEWNERCNSCSDLSKHNKKLNLTLNNC